MKTIIRFFLSTVAVLVTGCTPEEEHIPAQGGDSFTLSSSEEQVITRAGDVSVNHFTAGTKYRLYGLIGSSWSGRLSTMNGQEGTEVVGADGTHQIEYLSTGTDEDRFEGRILDFYALTYGNTTLPICGSEARWHTCLQRHFLCRRSIARLAPCCADRTIGYQLGSDYLTLQAYFV